MTETTEQTEAAAIATTERLAEELEGSTLAELVDQLARFFDRFGFRRNLGRIWAALYLAPEPLTQSDLSDVLGLSAGLISGGLRELEHYGAVRVVTVRGSRATHYEAEERLLRIVASILTKRELPSVRKLRETARDVRHRYEDELDASTDRAKRIDRRLRAIEQLCDLYESLTGLIRRVSRMPSSAIEATMRLVRAARVLDKDEDSASNSDAA